MQKVIAFVVRDGAVAVFRQDDEDSGLQVPAGTLREGEKPEAGALREAEGETGLSGLRIVRFVGRYRWDISPIREEIQDRHVYLLAMDGPVSERWESFENHDGARLPTPLHFFWLPLGSSELDELVVGQGTPGKDGTLGLRQIGAAGGRAPDNGTGGGGLSAEFRPGSGPLCSVAAWRELPGRVGSNVT